MGACSISKKEIILGGLNCAHCAEVINEKVSKLEEIEYCNLNFINKKLTLEIACDSNIDEDLVIKKVIKIVNDIEPGLDIKVLRDEKINNKKVEIALGGLNCAHCGEEIGNKVSKLDNVIQSNLNFISKKLTFEVAKNVDEKLVTEEIIKIINDTEPGLDIKVSFSDTKTKKENKEEVEISNKGDLIKLIIGSIMYIFGIFQTATGFESKFANIVFLMVYLIVGYDVLLKALKNASKGRVFDENFLMSIATVGAVIIGEVPEAVGVMLFYKIGEYLQDIAVGKSRKSITSLMQIRPDSANLKVGSEIKVVSPEEVSIGDIIVVKPGEKIPLDGVVVDGFSMVDTSALTGESVLREIGVGESALSGFINKNALLTIEVTKEFGESTVSKILDLVENASSKKSKTENFISKFAKYYTPFVLISAMVIAFIPPLVVPNAEFLDWFYRGLVFLVVSCPCALVLSIPLSFFSGIGNSSKHGILIKGSNYLEALKNVDTVVFDKTGTLTKGVFKVTKVSPVGISEKELIEYAAYAEANSNHPIAKSIVNYYKESIDLEKITYFEEIAAHGIKVKYNDLHILAGNDKLMSSENILYFPTDDIGTVVYIAVNGAYHYQPICVNRYILLLYHVLLFLQSMLFFLSLYFLYSNL
ncbi:heavy metal translocating P-type ATPase, partial [Romboutsia ilealis]|uniref:heavy metal translocating P-type ATPase n=1 Tax=Romboutsia ilealis TaxID=1115758 RepID=UPI00272C1B59